MELWWVSNLENVVSLRDDLIENRADYSSEEQA
jgi:hypothetical protein